MNALQKALAKALLRQAADSESFTFEGGLDTESSPLAIKPGRVVGAQNYEAAIPRGYRRIAGYERMDGRAKPSDAQYAVIDVTSLGTIAVGNTITGQTSAATAVVLAVVTTATPNYLVITKISGTFQNGENLRVTGVTQAVAASTANIGGASSTLLDAQYLNLAADQYRNDIAAVPGSGSILGGFLHNNINYAFRNNAGGTAAALYKSSGTGWTLVALGRELGFSTGGTEVVEGNTLTGLTSGASGVVTRVVRESGAWGGTAAGRFIFASVTGAFTNGENLQVSGVTRAVAVGTDAAITLSPSGRFETWLDNFSGSVSTKRVYGCDGVNRGWEFDGTVFVPIKTGMTVDKPTRVIGHKNHLFFGFAGGSVQHSGPGTPYIWSPVLGASEIAMGDDVSGFLSQPGWESGAALAIYTRNRTSVLYGSSSSTWNLVPYRRELGAYPHTMQDVGYGIFADDRGVTTFETSQAFGNFAHSAISNQVRSFFNERRTLTVASCVSRDLSQYRLFFSDRYVLYVTAVGKKILGLMPILLAHDVKCAWTGERNDGAEDIYFGSNDGFVYQMDKGTSFDGTNIEAFLTFPYHHSRSPRQLKRYRRACFEITGSGYAEFTFSFDLGYQSDEIPIDAPQTHSTGFMAGAWDVGNWDTGVWDGRTLLPVEVDLNGTAENIGLRMRSVSDYFSPSTFHGVILHYTPRRMLR